MVQDIRDTQGFTEISPSVLVQVETPIETPLVQEAGTEISETATEVSTNPSQTTTPTAEPVDLDPIQTGGVEQKTRGASVPDAPALQVQPQDPIAVHLPDLSVLTDLLGGPQIDPSVDLPDTPLISTARIENVSAQMPGLEGYSSVLSGLTNPYSDRDIQGVVAPLEPLEKAVTTETGRAQPEINQAELSPSSKSFVDPLKNPAVLEAVRNKYKGRHVPAAIRLNNMGAVSIVGKIEGSFGASQPGYVGVVKRPVNEGGYYAKYRTPEHGVGAASKLLERYGRQGTNTPNKITRKWAAEPGAYPKVLVKYLNEAGFKVNADSAVDLSNPKVRKAILKAKSAHESGFGRPIYTDAVFEAGVSYRFPS